MAATLAQLIRRPGLDLTVLAGADALDAAVRWVAVSELEDPTPYLQGGELLLTTGMQAPRTKAAADAYVARLIDVGVVGLGFGVKVVRAKVPVALIRAAREQGLPLVEVG
ncbi:MAG: PucR family transcriptional regulator ligand-binding domain-containing protein, partial [Nocardioidaceae bacterium]